MKQEIEFGKRCKGCKWAQYKCGRWEYCDIYYYTDGRKRPEPDGSGGCKHYTPASDLKLLCGVTTVSERTKKAIYLAVMGVNIAYYLTLILIASAIFNRCLDWLVSVW